MKKVMAFYALAAVWALLIVLPWSTPAQKSTITNQVTAVASDASMVPLTGKGHTGQTANLLQLKDSSDGLQFGITAGGRVRSDFIKWDVADGSYTLLDVRGNGSGWEDGAAATLFTISGNGNRKMVFLGNGLNLIDRAVWEGYAFQFSDSASTGSIPVPDAKALLSLDSTTRGFLPPQMTTTQRDAISSPPEGLLIINKSTHTVDVYFSGWKSIQTN